ncbi:DUF6894 family protein [Sphingomonas aliaeris]|uniref:DUF6894 family protein n=1 Tax=Sphingomonas aliaeris TaxID=2759526 RepID=UPI00384B62DA
MHLHDGVDRLLDEEGLVLSTDEVAQAALDAARDCIAGDVRKGRIDMRSRIDVEDHGGAIVHTLQFGDAVTIIQG